MVSDVSSLLFPAIVVAGFVHTVFLHIVDAQGESVTMDHFNSSMNGTDPVEDEEGKKSENKGAVALAISVTVLALIAVVIAIYFIKKRRQSLMLDKEKKMQMQMSSARNAGVYQDLTVSVPPGEKPPASPEHERLNTTEEA